ncbi:MAG: polysaccharide biosynthesis protein, partial [Gemmatimonadetes bacterium]|nr:polysaccharide biosynthesis protein [Gemmatimonadota bacterium]NIQ51929.1 polysaccharide biosynthesis protein [Gemmatimonadota bacterium]NIU72036.1 polysaccharide biosynthesis protein [Gammaproteobacteria bacterium]NIX42598.1 polysaccharide biosynthesis protein [Gemmatimonadota bacterium]NIY06773.1 polysaccharide biosynthesis protein [Gemmatimonadota bacterium]
MISATDSPRKRTLVVPKISALHDRAASTFLTHILIVPLAYSMAIFVRYEGHVPAELVAVFGSTVAFLLFARMTALAVFDVYQASWLHVGLRDLVALLNASAVGSALFAGLLAVTGQIPPVMPSVLLLEGMFFVFLSGGMRFGVRLLDENGVLRREPRARASRGTRALIIGAGEAGEALVRQLQHDARQGVEVVGLVDDDPRLRGRRIHGVPVVGPTRDLVDLVARHGADLVIIAIASATAEQMRRIVKHCMDTGVAFKTIPSLHDLLYGSGRLGQLREVDVADLLGRKPVELSVVERSTEMRGATVAVTGGAGSIGSELARQIARLGPSRLVLVDVAENGLYRQQLELAAANPGLEVVPIVCDVANEPALLQVFLEHAPEFVFHAAAHKHVPMMERHVVEAARNNVLGTLSVARAAVEVGARNVTVISTDKAIHPSSVMGATKRAGERLVLELPEFRGSSTRFCAVRFGNVLGSDGSVVPL